ncbi:hypothetical protein MF406_14175 [Georgenia sp. TF02-10]|uniref:hypothetical protein n=1 Tax=Georgenia sp. TF02-10 TaxID=2917725 RepID=UPI001FA7CE11|nr:hypothetical protein [Georgenia sp. TF02-10]UNX54079.1 hypothetical protein MF406_14175 [Georgenia sp. TF02-10]
MTDKPTIHATAASLETEAHPEPYRLGLSGGKVITFPDPGDMEMEEFEDFMADIEGQPNSVIFKRWLSDEDHKKLKAERLNIRQTIALAQKVTKHYEYIFGGRPEGNASTAS